jgi:hypothetical protein
VTRVSFGILLCLCLLGCAARTVPLANRLESLELTLARADGTRSELAAVSSKPTLLFLFATYDEASQLALVPLLRFIEQEPDIAVLGVALQPDAKAFLDMYQRALSIPFGLYFDPDNQLMRGGTALGRVTAVPAFVALDAQGRIRQRMYGVASGEQLRLLAKSARER